MLLGYGHAQRISDRLHLLVRRCTQWAAGNA